MKSDVLLGEPCSLRPLRLKLPDGLDISLRRAKEELGVLSRAFEFEQAIEAFLEFPTLPLTNRAEPGLELGEVC